MLKILSKIKDKLFYEASNLINAIFKFEEVFLKKRLTSSRHKRIIYNLLQENEGWLPNQSVSVSSIISARYRAIEDPMGSNRFMPFRWKMIYDDIAEIFRAKLDFSRNPVVLNFGAGNSNPFSLPLLFALNGASKVVVVEPSKLNEHDAIASLQEMVSHIIMCKDEYLWINQAFLIKRLDEIISLEALWKGQSVEDILKPNVIEYQQVRGDQIKVADGSVDLIYSRAVLEHVLNLDETLIALNKTKKKNGYSLHHIDLSSHNRENVFQFYSNCSEVDQAALNQLNGFRLSDYINKFESIGGRVEILEQDFGQQEVLDAMMIHERFKRYSNDDLLTIRTKLLIQKL